MGLLDKVWSIEIFGGLAPFAISVTTLAVEKGSHSLWGYFHFRASLKSDLEVHQEAESAKRGLEN